nr:PREDICTED: phosphotriesterase-related protein-like [Linepithema humile]
MQDINYDTDLSTTMHSLPDVIHDRSYVETLFGFKRMSILGITLVHEHLTSNFISYMQKLPRNCLLQDAHQDLCLSNIGNVKRYPYGYSKNLCLSPNESQLMIDELFSFKFAGGKTIVEMSSYGLNRNVRLLKSYSKMTNTHIIVGTGYYTAQSQPTSRLFMTSEELYINMLKEFSDGIRDCNDVHPAFIGEVGISWPIHDFERKSIIATGQIQEQLGCPVSFSPVNFNFARNDIIAPYEILRIYEEAGGCSRKAIMSHIQHAFPDKKELMKFVSLTNCFIQFDSFSENSICYQDNQFFEVPLNIQKYLNNISYLKQVNQLDRVLISHDIHTKNKLVSYGGQGYSYIFNNIVPPLLKRGFNIHEIRQILIENPHNWLQ